ncbi:helix-turn-helix domain-containing protein [Bdellovibrio bacteriovorus]
MPMGEFLKSKRMAAGLSQKEVSKQMGYSTPQFISNWERGLSHPPVSSLKKLSVLYKIDAQELFDKLLECTLVDVKQDLEAKFARVVKSKRDSIRLVS